jgi:hypothetical protein
MKAICVFYADPGRGLLGVPAEYPLAEKKALHSEDLKSYRAVFEQHGIHAFF